MDITSLSPKQQVKFQYWLGVIHECRASGLTNQAWCSQNNIPIKSYYYWISRIRKLALADLPRKENGTRLSIPCVPDASTDPPSGFEEIRIPEADQCRYADAPAAVIRAGDRHIEVFEHTSDRFLRRILKAVGEC